MKRALLILMMLVSAPAVAEPTYAPVPRLQAPSEPLHLQPVVIPKQEAPPIDKRPYLVAGGLLVLAAVFIWNRDRARKLEEHEGPTKPRERRWRVKPDAADDDDANDLADAAHGDDPEEKP